MQRYILGLTVFISGFVVMVLELVGARLLAPYLGTSLYVWTSLIGVILGSLSLGYYLGGKYADQKASLERLSAIILCAGIAIGVIALYQTSILSLFSTLPVDLRLRAVLVSLILFFVPNICLGMVTPYAVRLQLTALASTGTTVGNLGALSTIGSIAGTFACGFWLLSWFGHTRILFILMATLVGLSLFLIGSKKVLKIGLISAALVAAVLSSFITSSTVIADVDTPYNRLLVIDRPDPSTGRPTRGLTSSVGSLQSAMFLDGDSDLVFDYSKFYRLAGFFNTDIKKALLIGGGAYSYPKDFLRHHPGATVDVVEIDPAVTDLAQRYFDLPSDPRLTISHQDARVFLNEAETKYDVIFGDSFKSYYDVPYDLTTVEAVQSISDHLTGNGVYLVNIISSLGGEKSLFFQAEYATFKRVFPQVLIFPVQSTSNLNQIQNIMLVGLKNPSVPDLKSSNNEWQRYLNNYLTLEPHITVPPLTDNYAPVENYVAELVR